MRFYSSIILLFLTCASCTRVPYDWSDIDTSTVSLPQELSAILAESPTVELVSIDPDKPRESVDQGFHGYCVLGKSQITSDELAMLLQAMKAGMKLAEYQATCFEPRHGLRFTSKNHELDWLICFRCGNTYIFLDGEEVATPITTSGLSGIFNHVAKQHSLVLPRQPD